MRTGNNRLALFWLLFSAVLWAAERPDPQVLDEALQAVGHEPIGLQEHDYLYLSAGEPVPTLALVADGEIVPYTAFDGQQHTLHQFSGLYTAMLVSEQDLQQLTPELVREIVDRYDLLYEHFKELTDTEPRGEGLLSIAFVKTCGGGCGRLGAKGIEITPGYLNLVKWPNAYYRVVTHEMTHNFDRFSAFIMNGSTTAHAWTRFLNHYILVYDQSGTLDSAGNLWPEHFNAADWFQYNIDRLFAPYLNHPNATWEQCVRDDACDPQSLMARQIQGAVLLRTAQLHGPGFVTRWVTRLKSVIPTRGLSSQNMTAQDKSDLLIETLSDAAEANLTCYFDDLQWPISETLRSELAAKYQASPTCLDVDSDSYSVFERDCQDSNPDIHPGAVEILNERDDDCNGLVDDLAVQETEDFPNSRTSATLVPVPTRIMGTTESNKDSDHFRIDLESESSVRLTLQTSGDFTGWLFLYKQGSGVLKEGEPYSGGGFPAAITVTLGPGQWNFVVTPTNASVPGPYQLMVEKGVTWPSHFTGSVPERPTSGQYSLLAPEVPASLSTLPHLSTRFWVSGLGFVGSKSVLNSQASLDWTEPSQTDVSGMSYRIQFLSDGIPASYYSLPMRLEPVGQFFAQFGDGQGISSTAILVNPSSSQVVFGSVELFDSSGESLTVDINGISRSGAFDFEIPPLGADFFSTDGSGDLTTGSVKLLSYLPVGGTILISGGSGVAGVPATTPTKEFLLPLVLNSNGGFQTGVALSNPGDSEANAILRLRVDGELVANAEVNLVIPARAQVAKFIDQLFDSDAGDFSQFRGALEVNSDLALNGMAILVAPGEFATLPVVPTLNNNQTGSVDSEHLYFAQFGNGDGVSSTLIVVNPSTLESASGTVQIFDSEGNSLAVNVNGTVQNGSFDFDLAPQELAFYSTDGMGELVVGSVHVASDIPVAGTILFSGDFGVAGIAGEKPARKLLMPIELDALQGVRTGVALSNPADLLIKVALRLRDVGGTELASTSVSIAAKGQFSAFPEEIFEGQDIDFSSFRGTLEIVSPEPVSGMAVRVSPEQLATLPVTQIR